MSRGGLLFLVLVATAIATAMATATAEPHPAIASGEWRRHFGAAAAELNGNKAGVMHRIWISLKQRNTEVLEKTFWDVSNPRSSSYGKYLSSSQVTELVAPNPVVTQQVTDWVLSVCGSSEQLDWVANRDAVHVTLSVAQAEQLFGVTMHAYEQHPELTPRGQAPRLLIRSATQPTAIPAHLREHITVVRGISDFPPVSKRAVARNERMKAAANTKAAAKAGATFTPGVPTILRARGREQLMQIWYAPTCGNGQQSLNAAMPCADDTTSGFGVQTGTWLYAQTTINPTPASYSSSKLPTTDCALENGVVVCHVVLEVPWYDAYTVQIVCDFANVHNANVFTASNPNVVANIPPVTPQALWSYYGMGRNPRALTNVTQCVVEFEQQYYSESDLQLFFSEMGIVGAQTPVTVIGPNDQTNPGGEANLDLQWIMAMAPGVPTTFWSIGANSSVEVDDILTWAYAIGNMTNPPQVNSLSYGMSEGNVDFYLGAGYVARSDVEFMKLAVQGLTIIIADGDTGAGDLGGPPMGFSDCKTLHPDWPSQSPYVTAVGSTYLTPNDAPECYLSAAEGGANCAAGPLGEVGVALNFGIHWTTGGGFSNVQDQAPYQADAVNAYLRQSGVLPPSNMFNSTGRAYPDVVTCGHNLMTALSGTFQSIDGTSASAPIFAGMVTMWNDARVAAGKPVLGFLNQLMYDLAVNAPESFTDVVIGDNHCGGEGMTCCSNAYHATTGWDAVTGLGSPYWSAFTEAILALP